MAEQSIEKQEIVIVWLKRDLRFTDHEALYQAQKQELPILLIYCFEPSVMHYHDSDVRHWRFVYQSLREMNEKLSDLDSQLYLFHSEVLPLFDALQETSGINPFRSFVTSIKLYGTSTHTMRFSVAGVHA
jgi:deoxyribodipyrimidine photo-lyase